MKPLIKIWAFVVVFSVLCLAQQSNLSMPGFVLDQVSSRPIAGARITFVGNKAAADTTSDSEGAFIVRFALGVREGDTVRIHVEAAGYKPYEKLLPVSSSVPVRIPLQSIHSKSSTQLQPSPIIKQESFSMLIPVVVDDFGEANIPYETNSNDPLAQTYMRLSSIAYLPIVPIIDSKLGTVATPPLTQTDLGRFVGHTLQYYVLSKINEMQQEPHAQYEYNKSSGTSVTVSYSVHVPDKEEYPLAKLYKSLSSLNLYYRVNAGANDWRWTGDKFAVPHNTSIDLQDDGTVYSVSFEHKPSFDLQFKMKFDGLTVGVRTLPKNFLLPPGQKIKEAYSYVFILSMEFRWNGPHESSRSYEEWADGLFRGLQNSLVAPNDATQGNGNTIGNNVSGNGNVLRIDSQTGTTANAPNGIAITGGNVNGPTVNNYIKADDHVGMLKPAKDPIPDTLPDCAKKILNDGGSIVLLGTVAAASTGMTVVPVFSIHDKDQLTLYLDSKGMSISTDVFDEHDDIVVSIEKNKYTISNDAFQIIRPDDSSLSIVVKHHKEKILDVRFLNEHIIRVNGHFRYPDAHDVVADENGLVNGPMTLRNDCADTAGAALFGFQ